jgi:hypothetical protein
MDRGHENGKKRKEDVGRDKNIGTYFIDMLRRPGGKLGS